VAGGSHGMTYHPDANNPDRFTRQPYGPPDYVSAFFYLTDVNESTPVRHFVHELSGSPWRLIFGTALHRTIHMTYKLELPCTFDRRSRWCRTPTCAAR
jgi:hypothetical protein